MGLNETEYISDLASLGLLSRRLKSAGYETNRNYPTQNLEIRFGPL